MPPSASVVDLDPDADTFNPNVKLTYPVFSRFQDTVKTIEYYGHYLEYLKDVFPASL
jgi:hypothetical protein